MKKNGQNKIWIPAAIIIAIAAVSVFYYHHFFGGTEFTGKEKSIAVLPFININGDKADEYFSDGVTENIITELNRIEDLRVVSRASVISYKGSRKNLIQIGNELHVAALLQGDVKKSGNTLRINVRLVDVHSGKTIWAKVYENEIKDIFSIQNEMVQTVAGRLRADLTEDEKNIISKRPTQNLEAYNQYEKGRYFYYKRNDSSLRVAIDYFNQAIKLDPQYARAYSGLADSYSALGYISFELPSRAFLKAEESAVKALQLDSTLTEPHTSLGYIKFYYYWDWEGAEREFLKAIQLDPRYALAYDNYAYYLTALERFPEARVAMDKAVQLDPLSAQINTDKGFSLFYALDYDQAFHCLKTALEINPSFPLAHVWLARVYQERKMFKESIAEYEKTLLVIKDWPVALAGIGYVYGISGNRKEAEKMLVKLDEVSVSRYVTPYGVALVYASLNENDKAFEWLGKAYEERSNWLVWLKQDPRWKLIKNDPRYAELVSKVGLQKKGQPFISQ